jgi:hypothetical protein
MFVVSRSELLHTTYISFLHVSARKRAILRRYSAKMYAKEGDIKMNGRGVFLTSIDDVPVKDIVSCSASSSVLPFRSPAEILGSNPTGGMDICLL